MYTCTQSMPYITSRCSFGVCVCVCVCVCPGAPHGRLPRDSSRRHCVTHDPPVRPRLRRLPLMHPLLNVSMHAIGILCLSKSLLTAAAGAALGSTTATETFSCRSARRAWMALRRVQQMHTHTHTHTHSLSLFSTIRAHVFACRGY